VEIVGNLAFGVLFGVLCALIAHSRGRSPFGWFFIGLFLTCIGLILVLVLPDLAEEQGKQHRLEIENRRLRELVRKDRQVADSRHAEITRRLETHDRALGLDTVVRAPLLDGAHAELPGIGVPPNALASLDWYYVRDGEAKGPVRFEELRRLGREGIVHERSLIWHDGLADWLPLADIPGLSKEFHV
jgi:hypothetical protein